VSWLLDVNLVLATRWTTHAQHQAAKAWIDDVDGTSLPETNSSHTTDAHLVVLAMRHGLKLATLDTKLIAEPWATGIAENPLMPQAQSSDRTPSP
jgi:predicted nucleic acid-binding protein